MKKEKLIVGGKYLKVNGKYIITNGYFAYDGCHKIYVLETKKDWDMAIEFGYQLIPSMDIRYFYEKSCPLKFIHSMNLKRDYVPQGEEAIWEEEEIKNDTEVDS